LIRIHLTIDDLERIRIAERPDFGYELALGGGYLASGARGGHLSAWRREVARVWNPNNGRLFDLYTRLYMPAFFAPVTHATSTSTSTLTSPSTTGSGIDPTSPPAVAHLRDLADSRALTPFTRALANGHTSAVTTLNRILADFRAAALDPFRRRITSVVATASAQAGTRASISGTAGMLRTLTPSVHWDGRILRLDTSFDGRESLDGRPLIFQPSVLATRITFNPLADSVTVSYPATAAAITRDSELRTPPPALVSLLGATRAAALSSVVKTPGVTNGTLAQTLGVSAAAASRHASVLRESGLIATVRSGQSVHHNPTSLGKDLIFGSNVVDQTQG
jgi:DNA-binding transcriptional ArsR family regulator